MAWARPQHSRSKVNEAGEILIKDTLLKTDDDYLTIINNWRSSHGFPLNTFQSGLRTRGRNVFSKCLVAQRIKRLSSIVAKLRRFPTMTLSQMQDIGGCRVVLKSANQVRELHQQYLESSIKHSLHTTDDYIASPRESGYRGLHLIYTYYSDRNSTYNGLKIEMQFRSFEQHAWATAVETVGTFVQQALKSSQGEEGWLRFFSLMGSALAIKEKTPLVPGTPTSQKELRDELRHYSQILDVENRLIAYGAALLVTERVDDKKAHFFVIKLNPQKKEVSVTSFQQSDSDSAAQNYISAEKEVANIPGGEAVLVSVDSATSLRRAFPNYFLDTRRFLILLRQETELKDGT